jgi:hypothetical protein
LTEAALLSTLNALKTGLHPEAYFNEEKSWAKKDLRKQK